MKQVSILVVLLCGLLLIGCTGGAQGNVDMDDLFDSIKDQIQTDLREFGFGDEDFAAEVLPGYTIFDIKGEDADYVLPEMDKDDVEEGIAIKASMMLNSDQIVILKAAAGKVDSVKEALEAELEGQLELWENYLADQAAKVRETIITVQGDYIIYITYPNPEAIEDIFNQTF